MNLIFLPLILVIGGVSSYTDAKWARVSNKLILWGAGGGAVGYVAVILTGVITKENVVSNPYLSRVALNTFIALCVGYGLWKLNFWAAGDAKLFALYAWLIPHGFYWKSYFQFFPSFALLVNIFFAIFAVLLLSATRAYLLRVYHFIFPEHAEPLRQRMAGITASLRRNRPLLVRKVQGALGLGGIILILQVANVLIERSIGAALDRQMFLFSVFAGMLLFQDKVRALMARRHASIILTAALALSISILGWSVGPAAALDFVAGRLGSILGYVAAFGLAESLINSYIARKYTQEIPVSSLSAGQMPHESFFEDFRLHLRQQPVFSVNHADGLSIEQVELVKQWAMVDGRKSIVVYADTFSFAGWIFAGVILTLATSMSVVSSLMY